MTNPVHLDPDTMTKVAKWRALQASGTMTLDDYKLAILDLRQSRLNAQAQPKAKSGGKKASVAKGPAKSTDDMIGELDSL